MELSSRLLTEPWAWAIDNTTNAVVDVDADVDSMARSPAVSSPVNGNGDGGVPSPGLVEAGGKMMLGLVVARAADTAPTVR